jgi:predicted alpha-1,2-mannosidase
MGGDDDFISMLDSVFVVPPIFDDSYYGFPIHEIREMQIAGMGNYAHGNQPIQHMIYLYNYSTQPWKAQKWVREVLHNLYSYHPDGYCGDEDNGQTSAWYVFSSMGFYPVCPGTDEYVFGSPLFDKVTLQLENGNEFVIHAKSNSKENVFIDDIRLNGADYKKNFISHAQIQAGGKLSFSMAGVPNKKRGTTSDSFPYSMTEN